MAFIQLIECRTDRFEEIQALEEEWRTATEGKRTLQRSIVGRDRDDPTRVVIIALFDSYEAAMANSELPETAAFAEKQSAIMSEAPRFVNLDVIEDRD